MEQKTLILVGASLLMLIFSFGCLIQTHLNNQNGGLNLKTLLDKPAATECIAHKQVKNGTLYLNVITVPHKYIIMKTYMTNKQGELGSPIFNSTIAIDVAHRVEYLEFPKVSGTIFGCDGAPYTCYWLKKNLSQGDFSNLETEPLVSNDDMIQCKEITNPPKFPVNPQEACTTKQIDKDTAYCLCTPLKETNQTLYEKCMNQNS